MYMVISCFTHPYSIRKCNGTYDLPDLHTPTITVTAECVQGILPAEAVTITCTVHQIKYYPSPLVADSMSFLQ